MKRWHGVALLAAVLAMMAMPVMAQDHGAEEAAGGFDAGILGASFAIGVAALGGALGQARATAAACSAMARNPGSAGNVRFALILGLALIESLVLYALIIALKGSGLI